MTNPIDPNFKPGVGRLATDRYDFQSHVNGTAFQHTAGQIVLSPPVTIGITTVSDVQTAIAELSGSIVIPTVPNATKTSTGVIQLGGDLNGLNSTALNPQLSSLQGYPLSLSGTASVNDVIQWNGSAWVRGTIPPATTGVLGTILLSTLSSISTGDIGGSATNTKVIGLQGVPISSATPSSGNVLVFSAGSWQPGSASGTPAATTSSLGTIQLNGDLGGSGTTATIPRVGGLNGATVPAAPLTTNQVLIVSGSTTLTYGLIADANVSATAAIQGSKITPNFGSQVLTAGVSSLGATTVTGTLTAGSGTSFNTLTGAFTVTTKTITASTNPTAYTVDTGTTDHILFVDTTNGVVNITLPAIVAGRRLIIKDKSGTAGANNINLIRHASESIEGLAATKALGTAFGSWTVVSDGTNWFLI